MFIFSVLKKEFRFEQEHIYEQIFQEKNKVDTINKITKLIVSTNKDDFFLWNKILYILTNNLLQNYILTEPESSIPLSGFLHVSELPWL